MYVLFTATVIVAVSIGVPLDVTFATVGIVIVTIATELEFVIVTIGAEDVSFGPIVIVTIAGPDAGPPAPVVLDGAWRGKSQGRASMPAPLGRRFGRAFAACKRDNTAARASQWRFMAKGVY